MRSLFINIFTVALVFLNSANQLAAAEKITLQLRWDNQFQFAGYYAAQWQGFYEKEGLEVTILPAVTAKGIISAVEEVAAKRADFGVGAADILMARDKGVPLVVLASIFQHSAAGFYTKKGTKLDVPADFLNLKVARRVNDLIDIELQTLLKSEGIDPEKVTPYPHQPGMDHLLSNKVDVVPGYVISFPFEAEDIDLRINTFRTITYGIDLYGDSLFAHADLVKGNPDLVQRFTKASLEGWNYAMKNREEVAKQITDTLPRTSKRDKLLAFNLFQSEGMIALMNFPEVEIGHINPARWGRMHEYLRTIGIINSAIDIDNFIFDPAKIKIDREVKAKKILIISFSIAIIIAMILFVWVKTLKKTMKNMTKGLRDSNKSLKKQIKKRRKTEEQLLKAAQHINAHIDNSPLAVIEFDSQLRITRWSKEAERIFGWTAEEIAGKVLSEIPWVYPEDNELVQQETDNLFSGKQKRSLSANRNYRKDGSVVHCEWYNSGIYNTQGELISILSQVLDVTDRKRTEEKSAEHLAELTRWHHTLMGREDRVIEIKQEVNELLARLGEPTRYKVTTEKEKKE